MANEVHREHDVTYAAQFARVLLHPLGQAVHIVDQNQSRQRFLDSLPSQVATRPPRSAVICNILGDNRRLGPRSKEIEEAGQSALLGSNLRTLASLRAAKLPSL
jgi:hypothetical protein